MQSDAHAMTALQTWGRLAQAGEPVPGEIKLRGLIEALEIRARLDAADRMVRAGIAVKALAEREQAMDHACLMWREIHTPLYERYQAMHGCSGPSCARCLGDVAWYTGR